MGERFQKRVLGQPFLNRHAQILLPGTGYHNRHIRSLTGRQFSDGLHEFNAVHVPHHAVRDDQVKITGCRIMLQTFPAAPHSHHFLSTRQSFQQSLKNKTQLTILFNEKYIFKRQHQRFSSFFITEGGGANSLPDFFDRHKIGRIPKINASHAIHLLPDFVKGVGHSSFEPAHGTVMTEGVTVLPVLFHLSIGNSHSPAAGKNVAHHDRGDHFFPENTLRLHGARPIGHRHNG